tara:strand:+ start:2927 stop:3391 length:465 start_codon:yes stop_codon:yes gene_type:complete
MGHNMSRKNRSLINTTNSTHATVTEQSIIFKHMLNGQRINSDQAYSVYGIKHLHSVIPRIERYVKVNREEISRKHHRTGKIRIIANYWIDDYLIGIYESAEAREELKKRQTSINIAKSRASDNRALNRLCKYSTYETVLSKLHEIYGQQAANDD